MILEKKLSFLEQNLRLWTTNMNLLEKQIQVSLILWSPGPLVLWSPGPLVSWSRGPLLPWSSGPLVPWSLHPLVPGSS